MKKLRFLYNIVHNSRFPYNAPNKVKEIWDKYNIFSGEHLDNQKQVKK